MKKSPTILECRRGRSSPLSPQAKVKARARSVGARRKKLERAP